MKPRTYLKLLFRGSIGWCIMFLVTGFSSRVYPELNKVLVFSRCDRYEHTNSKNSLIAYVKELGEELGFDVVASDNAAQVLTDQALTQFDLTVWNNNCWLNLNNNEKEAFQKYMESGGNYVGVHCAGAIHGLWPWYSETLLNADLVDHAGVTNGRAYIEQKNRDHPILKNIPDEFWISEEWYRLDPDPADNPDNVILVLVDEDTYKGAKMGGYHPMAWSRELNGGGKMFYTAFGHESSLYTDNEQFRTLLRNAVQWTGQAGTGTVFEAHHQNYNTVNGVPKIISRQVYDLHGRKQMGTDEVYRGGFRRNSRVSTCVHIVRTIDNRGCVSHTLNILR